MLLLYNELLDSEMCLSGNSGGRPSAAVDGKQA